MTDTIRLIWCVHTRATWLVGVADSDDAADALIAADRQQVAQHFGASALSSSRWVSIPVVMNTVLDDDALQDQIASAAPAITCEIT